VRGDGVAELLPRKHRHSPGRAGGSVVDHGTQHHHHTPARDGADAGCLHCPDADGRRCRLGARFSGARRVQAGWTRALSAISGHGRLSRRNRVAASRGRDRRHDGRRQRFGACAAGDRVALAAGGAPGIDHAGARQPGEQRTNVADCFGGGTRGVLSGGIADWHTAGRPGAGGLAARPLPIRAAVGDNLDSSHPPRKCRVVSGIRAAPHLGTTHCGQRHRPAVERQ